MWKFLIIILALLPLFHSSLDAQLSIENPNSVHFVNENINIKWNLNSRIELFWKNSSEQVWSPIKSFPLNQSKFSWQLPYINNNIIQLKIESIPNYSFKLYWEQENAHTSEIRSATFSADMKHIITASDFSIKVWDLDKRTNIEEINFTDIGRIRNAISYRSIDTIIISTDNSFYLYDLINRTLKTIGIETSSMVRYSRVHHNLPIVAYGDHSSNIALYNIETGQIIWQQKIDPKDEINSVNFSSTGDSIVFGGGIGQIYVVNWKENSEIIRFGRHGTESGQNQTIFETSFSECGKFVLSCGVDAMIRLWSIDLMQEINNFEGHTSHIRSADYLDANTFISASLDETLKIWNIEDNELLHSEPFGSPVVFSDISQDREKIIASGRNDSFKIWQILKDEILADSIEFLAGYKFNVIAPKIRTYIGQHLTIPFRYSHNYFDDLMPFKEFSTSLYLAYPKDSFVFDNEIIAGYAIVIGDGNISSNVLAEISLLSLQGDDNTVTIQIDSIITIDPKLYYFFSSPIDFDIQPNCSNESNRKIIVDNGIKINTFINNKTLSIDVYFVEDGLHSIELFALSGVRVKEIVKEELNYGNHSFNSIINELAKGVYLVVLTTPTSVIIEKIINMD